VQIVLAVALIGALVAAVRSRIMAAVRNCKECRGYGIERRASRIPPPCHLKSITAASCIAADWF